MKQITPRISGPVDVRGRLAEWGYRARGAFAPNTERALRADSAAFSAWCMASAVTALPATPDTIAAFLRAQADDGKAIATLRRRTATIARMHRAAGLPNPCDSETIRLTLRAIARAKGTQQKQAAPLSRRDADRIIDRIAAEGARLRDRRDVALMLVGRDLLARASELISITVDAVEWIAEDAARIALRRHKTSTQPVWCRLGPDAATALRIWLEAAQITSGTVFRSVTKGGQVTNRALSVRDVGRIILSLTARAKLQGQSARFSSHSLRVGMAIDLVAASVESAAIMQAAGWKSARMLAHYTERLECDRGAIAKYYRLGASNS